MPVKSVCSHKVQKMQMNIKVIFCLLGFSAMSFIAQQNCTAISLSAFQKGGGLWERAFFTPFFLALCSRVYKIPLTRKRE